MHVDYHWEDICEQQVKDIYDHYYQWYTALEKLEGIYPVEQLNAMLEYMITETEGLSKPLTNDIINRIDDNPIFFDIAGYAIHIIDSTNNYPHIDWHYISSILINKQKDYGPENIMKFGVTGILVRLFDKVARLNNLLLKTQGNIKKAIDSNSVNGESLIDTLIDIVGYCTIALMILEPDKNYQNKFLTPMNYSSRPAIESIDND
jgi:hypothetical protein